MTKWTLDSPERFETMTILVALFIEFRGYVVELERRWLDNVLNNYVCELTINGHVVGFAYRNGKTFDLDREVSRTAKGLINLYEFERGKSS